MQREMSNSREPCRVLAPLTGMEGSRVFPFPLGKGLGVRS